MVLVDIQWEEHEWMRESLERTEWLDASRETALAPECLPALVASWGDANARTRERQLWRGSYCDQ